MRFGQKRSSVYLKRRLRAECVMLSEELCILASCCFLGPISRNQTFLEELRYNRSAIIQDEEHFVGE